MALPPDFDPDGPSSGEGIFGLPEGLDRPGVVLIPIPWDATVSYGSGAAGGPEAIRRASQQVDLYDHETGRPYEAGIQLAPVPPEVAKWCEESRLAAGRVLESTEGLGDPEHTDARLVDDLSQRLNDWLDAEVRRYRAQGALVGVIGGEHSVPFGSIRAHAKEFQEVGILQVDAHADLRESYLGFRWSHASIFDNVLREIPEVTQLTQVGIRDLAGSEAARTQVDARIRTFFDADLQALLHRGGAWSDAAEEIVHSLPQNVYVSIDIDGLDPSLCPHTGTPVPGGLTFAQVTSLLAQLIQSGRTIVGFDLCEVAPDPTGRSEWDGNVGARVLYKLIGFALLSRSSG